MGTGVKGRACAWSFNTCQRHRLWKVGRESVSETAQWEVTGGGGAGHPERTRPPLGIQLPGLPDYFPTEVKIPVWRLEPPDF